jgi:N-acyl-D-amino-acid deacylase
MCDLVIRGGEILDGSGRPSFVGDIAIEKGIIQEVGQVSQSGKEEIDARGLIVTPGFVDLHTHYDGQITWDQSLSPSTGHGVTTVVTGNCGVGFAPCRPHQREVLVRIMEGVEDIPEVVMAEGVPWEWETFPEYLDFLERRQFDADVGVYLPHAALRVFVMGDRGAAGEIATPDDCSQMADLVTEAIRTGALGISTSRSLLHRASDGSVAPHVKSDANELFALAKGLGEAGDGVFQMISHVQDQLLRNVVGHSATLDQLDFVEREMELLRQLAKASNRPLFFSLVDNAEIPTVWRQVLDLLGPINEQGCCVKAQIFPRPIGILYGLDLSIHPFSFYPSYFAIRHLPLAERVKTMRSSEFRARILAEKDSEQSPNQILHWLAARSLDAFAFKDVPNYDPPPEDSLRAEAARRGLSVLEVAYDKLLENEGRAILFLPSTNFTAGNLNNVLTMLKHEHTLIGLGDGGAHYGMICDASYPTFMLSYWCRDRLGEKIPLPSAIQALTWRNAQAVGLTDRGLIARGLRADLNLIDFDKVSLGLPNATYDLPSGGRRLVQAATGYVASIVNGCVTRRDGASTGNFPGRLIRRKQPAAMRAT